MSGIVSDEEIEKWVHKLEEINYQVAYYFGEKYRLEELRKTLKSNLMKEFEKEEMVKSKKPPAVAIQERYAYSHPSYINLVEKIAGVNRNWSFYSHQLKAFEMKYNIWRSQQASLRTQRNMYENG